MAREFSRTERVSHSIRRAIAPLIDETVREERLGMVSVTDVDVSPDLRQSNVFVSVFGSSVDNDEVIRILQDKAAAWRFELGRQLRIKNIPALRFRLDTSLEQGDRVSRLIKEGSNE